MDVRTVRCGRSWLAVTIAAVMTLLTAGPAAAQTPEVVDTERLAPGVEHQQLRIRLGGGATARGNLVRWQETGAGTRLVPQLAGRTIVGAETMLPMARRALRDGAVAGVNGGYWVPRPTAAPNGPYVAGGGLHSGLAVSISGNAIDAGRGTVGIRHDGRVLLDRLEADVTLTLPRAGDDPLDYTVNEINRQPRCPATGRVTCPARGEVALYDEVFGTAITAPAGSTVVVLDRRRIPSAGSVRARVVSSTVHLEASTPAVPAGQLLLVAHGPERGSATAALTPGDEVTITTALRPAGAPDQPWDELESALPGAPLLLRDGARQPALYSAADGHAETEALGTSHRLGRHPRTAIGRTPAGELFLLTVDGRDAGWSSGVTLLELAGVLEGLGASDAVNLDGGGPSTMTVHGGVVNRASDLARPSANALFLHVPQRTWHGRDALSAGPSTSTLPFAFAPDQVLACDWNADGQDTPGAFANGRWVLSNRADGRGALRTFGYGRGGDTAVCGDWNGDGRDTVGVRRGDRLFLRDSNTTGVADFDFAYGRDDDHALIGDWNADGRDTLGVRRGNRFLLRNANSGGAAQMNFTYGRAGDTPLVGDWNADGRDTLGVRRDNQFLLRAASGTGDPSSIYRYGRATDTPVAGDFGGDGGDTITVVR